MDQLSSTQAVPKAIAPGATDEGLVRDRLTGLPTRPALYRRLTEVLALPDATGSLAALIALDLDRFQLVNDSTGIPTGDAMLNRVASRILRAVPDTALVARISGDEFAVLLVDGSTAEAIATRLLELLARPYAVNGHALTISASAGVARATAETNADSLVREAAIALHRAEAEGKNRWLLFEPWMQLSASTRQEIETDLRTALGLNRIDLRKAMVVDQFEVHYQPQVTVRGRRLQGFEALARWRHPTRGLVPPDEFIPIAEEIGLIGLIGDWVLRTACRTAASWPVPADGKPLQIAVNVSPIQLRERRALVGSIADALATTGLAAGRLEIEITESALIGDALDTLRAIRALGVRLSLDAVGTGYSSLSELVHYPFDCLKIDRAFVKQLPAGPGEFGKEQDRAGRLLRAISSIGSGLGMSTVAEGVETEHQASLVREAGVTVLQGYLISRPVAPEDLATALIRFGVTPGIE